MKYYVEESLRNFPFWSGGKDTADELTSEQIDTIEQYLEDVFYGKEVSDTDINDFFRFERDKIYEILGIDEDGNEIGSEDWAKKILTDNVSSDFADIAEIYLEEYYDGQCEDEDSLADDFDEYLEHFKDMNGELIHVGDKVHWIDPAYEDYTEEEYDAQCEEIHEVVSMRSDMIVLDNSLEVCNDELEVIK